MPSLKLFGRKWRIGSDDFVFPGLFEAGIRAGWLILTLVLYAEHLNDSQKTNLGGSSCSKGENYIRIYLTGVLVILAASLILSILLVIHSAKGTIMVTAPRRYVSKIVMSRVVFGVIEVCWNILGTVWLFSGEIICNKTAYVWILLQALIIYTWVALFLLILTVVLLFEPMMRPDQDHIVPSQSGAILDHSNSGIGSHYIQLWERRCRLLFCIFARDEASAEAFRNVADLLASIFEESDLVPSDILAALVLLRLHKKYEEKQIEKENNQHVPKRKFPSLSSTCSFTTPPPEWMTLANAYHYMKFAMGSYGWPWYVYGRLIRACFSMKRFIRCCGCCRPSSIRNSQDNCCRCNLAALRAITNLPEENIIYLSFHNKIYEAPFFVAIDDEKKNIVVAIRGTLSLYDAVTDLNAQSTLLGYEGLPSDCRAHKGMVNVAQFVRGQLEKSGAIEKAFRKRPRYGLVITGHSLGAGAAVLLATMLRPQFPNLKCFAFSPPGGLCSFQMYTATQEFVMAVVVGDDLVPRLSISAIYNLREKITNVLHLCKKPKYRVLAKGCWYMLFGISQSSLQSCTSRGNPQEQLISPHDSGSYSYVSPTSVEEESIQDIRIIFSEEPPWLPRHMETPLFPPGRILNLTVSPSCDRKEPIWNVRWASNCEFPQILITPNMLRHHLPQVVLASLQTAYDTHKDAPIL